METKHDIINRLASNLRYLRINTKVEVPMSGKIKYMSQKDLAEMMGIGCEQQVSKFELATNQMSASQVYKVAKNATNPHFKKSYADINALLETVEPILHENGLVLLQPVKDHIVFTQIIDIDSGDMIESWMQLPEITDPQKLLGAITYFRRGTLQSLLALQSVDDDGNTASASAKKPTLSEEQFTKAKDAISSGKYSLEQLKTNYSLTKDQEAQL